MTQIKSRTVDVLLKVSMFFIDLVEADKLFQAVIPC